MEGVVMEGLYVFFLIFKRKRIFLLKNNEVIFLEVFIKFFNILVVCLFIS